LHRCHARGGSVGVMRRTAAVWAGKAAGALSRLSGRGGGTTLRGDVARASDPTVLRKLTGDLTEGSIVITGTNGKTTTARLLTSIFEGMGKRVVSNRAGANLIFGATAAALRSAGPDGRLRADWGVFEIDEASLPRAVEEIQPRIAIVLNLFRDQLDRYGELEEIAKTIEAALESIPEGAQAVLDGFDSAAMNIGETRLELPVGGLYNAYNALAAFAAGMVLGVDGQYMAERMHGFKAAFGRQEKMDFRGRHLVLVLSKNPAGFNETLRTAVDMAGATHFILGLNDRKADGTDVSWIWDVDFEQLAGKAEVVVPAGTRAHDLAVRLKYAGVESRPPQTEPGRALDDLISVTPEGATAHILCTYTAMLDIRAELVRRGWAKPYWET